MSRKKAEKVFSVEELNRMFRKEFLENRKIFKSIQDQLNNHQEKNLLAVENCIKKLQEIMKINEEMVDTVRSIMLAIKQNSFLQAWYPDQQGCPDSKSSSVCSKEVI